MAAEAKTIPVVNTGVASKTLLLIPPSSSQNTARPNSAPLASYSPTTMQFSDEAAKLLASTISLWKVPKKKISSWREQFRSPESRELNKMRGMTMKLSDVVAAVTRTIESTSEHDSELNAVDIHQKTLSAICLPQSASHLTALRNAQASGKASIWSYLLHRRASTSQVAEQRTKIISQITTHLKRCPLFDPTTAQKSQTSHCESTSSSSSLSTSTVALSSTFGSTKFGHLCEELAHHPHITIQSYSPHTVIASPSTSPSHIHIVTSGTINVSASCKTEAGDQEVLLCTIEQYGVVNVESALFSSPAYQKWRRGMRRKRVQELEARLERAGQEEIEAEIISKNKNDHIKQMEWDEAELHLDEEIPASVTFAYPSVDTNPLLHIVKMSKSQPSSFHTPKKKAKTSTIWHEWATYETQSAVEVVTIPINVFLSHINSHEMLTNYAFVSTMYKHWHYRTLYCNAATRCIRMLTFSRGENGEEATDSAVRGSNATDPDTQSRIRINSARKRFTGTPRIEKSRRKLHHPEDVIDYLGKSHTSKATETKPHIHQAISNNFTQPSASSTFSDDIEDSETGATDTAMQAPLVVITSLDTESLRAEGQATTRRRIARTRWKSSAYIITTQLIAEGKLQNLESIDDSILDPRPQDKNDEEIHYRRDSIIDERMSRRESKILHEELLVTQIPNVGEKWEETKTFDTSIFDAQNSKSANRTRRWSLFLESHSASSTVDKSKLFLEPHSDNLNVPGSSSATKSQQDDREAQKKKCIERITSKYNMKDVPRVRHIPQHSLGVTSKLRNIPSKKEISETAHECLQKITEDKQIEDYRRALLTESGSKRIRHEKIIFDGKSGGKTRKDQPSQIRPETAPIVQSSMISRNHHSRGVTHSHTASFSQDLDFRFLDSLKKPHVRRSSSKAFPMHWKERLANLIEVSHQPTVL